MGQVGHGIETAGFPADLSRPAEVPDLIAAIRDRFGRIDVIEYGPISGEQSFSPATKLDAATLENATDQARIAARSLCGRPTSQFTPPWFWSDQYDHKLQIAGLPRAEDTAVVRGDPQSNSFSVVYLRDRTVTGLHAVNRPRDFSAGKRLVASRAPVIEAEIAADDVALSELATRHQATVEGKY